MFKKRIRCSILVMLCASLLLCVVLNVYSAYILTSVNKPSLDLRGNTSKVDETKLIELKILQQLSKLPTVYKNKNPEFIPILFGIRDSLNASYNRNPSLSSLWEMFHKWPSNMSLYPEPNYELSQILHALKSSKIVKADNAKKGTQLKLLLTLEGNQTVIFKPKWYNRDMVIHGRIYEGHDRHNSEVLGFILSMLLNIRWSPISVLRSIHLKKDVWSNATPGLKKTTIFTGHNQICVYGECLYCERKYSVCADEGTRLLEGAVILVVPGTFKSHPSPWRRTYKREQAKWETDIHYCKKVEQLLPSNRILDLVETAIFDFLLQNGDRHHYEVFENRVLLMDNGKGLGNPHEDHIDILAPLYHCCILRKETWERLLLLTGQMLSFSVKTLEEFFLAESGISLTTNLHLKALDRKMLKVFAAVRFCLETKGAQNVFSS